MNVKNEFETEYCKYKNYSSLLGEGTTSEFCFTMIGRANIEGSENNVAMNAWINHKPGRLSKAGKV